MVLSELAEMDAVLRQRRRVQGEAMRYLLEANVRSGTNDQFDSSSARQSREIAPYVPKMFRVPICQECDWPMIRLRLIEEIIGDGKHVWVCDRCVSYFKDLFQ